MSRVELEGILKTTEWVGLEGPLKITEPQNSSGGLEGSLKINE